MFFCNIILYFAKDNEAIRHTPCHILFTKYHPITIQMKKILYTLLTAAFIFTHIPSANATITEPVAKVILEEDFSLVPAIDPWKGYRMAAFDFDTYEINPEFTHIPGWSGWMMTYGKESGMLHFDYDDESDTGYLSTPSLELSADGGKVTIKFEYRKDMTGLTNKEDRVHPSLYDVANNKNITGIYTNSINVDDQWKEYSITLTGGTADCAVRIYGGSYPGDIRNIRILQVRPELDAPVADACSDFKATGFTANWRSVEGAETYLLDVFTDDNGDGKPDEYTLRDHRVDGTSFEVTGLDPERIYCYQVRARGGELTSANSNIVRCFGVTTPELGETTDITDSSFNLSWLPAYNANIYEARIYLRHTAQTAERYYLLDEDFLNTPNQDINPDKVPMGEAATVSLDEYLHRADWTGSMIGYAADCITLDNLMASSGIYGEVDSPILDLSAGGGKVNIEMRARALNAASLSIFLMKYNADSKWGFHDEISSIKLWEPNSLYDPLTENWTDYNYTIEGGRDDAFLALQAYGYGAKVQIDRLAISQDLNAGESVTVPFIRYIGSELCALVDAANEHIGSSDAFEFKVRAAYLPDNDNEETVYSDWSETRSIKLAGNSGTGLFLDSAPSAIRTENGKIIVENPEGKTVSIHTLTGINAGIGHETLYVSPRLATGIYIVSIGNDRRKVALR